MKGMKPLVKLEEMRAADGSLWELWERDGVLSLLQDGVAVADTLSRGSEERMAQLAVAPIARAGKPCVLVAGIGLGYAAAATIAALPRARARFIIAEPIPELINWLSTHSPNTDILQDERVSVENESAAEICRKRIGSLHAIIMRHTHGNLRLSLADAQAFFQALKGGSLLAILLERPDKKLQGTLQRAGFEVSCSGVPVSSKGKQTRMHTLVLARRGRFVPFAERS